MYKILYTLMAVSTLAACTSAPLEPMATVPSVDLNRYLGNWYQVSLIPNKFQSMCVADTQANYALADTWTGDDIRVINRCRTVDSSIETALGVAKVVDGSHNAKLKVSFFRPFYGNYWVLALGDNYDWVLVGEPKRQFGWILSRKPRLDEASMNKAYTHAEKLGYTRQQFVSSPQTKPLD